MSARLRGSALLAVAVTALSAATGATGAGAAVAARTGRTLHVTLQLALPDPPAVTRLGRATGLTRADRLQRLRPLLPSAAAADRVGGLAVAEGLTVTGRTPFSVQVSGPASVVDTVFGHSLGAGGRSLSLHLPASMAGLVAAAVGGDDDRAVFQPRAFSPTPVTGALARSVYNAPAGTPASGVADTVATVQFSGWDASAFTRFAARVGKPDPVANGTYTPVSVDAGSTTTPAGSGDIEVALDQESIYDTAPAARQRAYFAPNSFAAYADVVNRVATDALSTAPDFHLVAFSTSWGLCEQNIAPASITAISTAFAALTAAGVTSFASSGDAGPFDCSRDTAPDNTLAVDYPASDPNVVSVGGTTLDGRVLSSPAEQTWWQPCPCVGAAPGFRGAGGGAGESTVFAKPSYQTGLLPARTGRLVPDVAATANPSSGFVLDVRAVSLQVGGTSLAAPLSAALFTDLLATGGITHGIGDIHALLYGAPGRTFRDITVGIDGTLSAGPGYDLATGLGATQWGQLASTLYPVVAGSRFVPVSPCRVFDTRTGTATCPSAAAFTSGPVGPGGTRTITIGGASGVPANATAVVLNVTAVSPTAGTAITVFPHRSARPTASNLNLVAGQPATPNLVTVRVGAFGQVDLFNSAGSVQLLADLAGYFVPASGSGFVPVTPCRVFDTRSAGVVCGNAAPVPVGPVGAAGVLSVPLAGRSGVPADATAVVLNVTGVAPTASTFVTVFPHQAPAVPNASNLNLAAGAAPRPNLVVVPLDASGAVDFFNRNGSIHLVADLAGYFTVTGGDSFHPVDPCRAFDTRNGLGSCVGSVRTAAAPVGPHAVRTVQLAGPNAIPESATAVVLNVTAVAPTASTVITVYPDGLPRPNSSNVNIALGSGPTPNLVVVPVGATTKQVGFFNSAGSVHLVVDVAGWFG